MAVGSQTPTTELQKQAIWLFGVLVGLSMKEAITDVFDAVEARQDIWGGSSQAVRLVVEVEVVRSQDARAIAVPLGKEAPP